MHMYDKRPLQQLSLFRRLPKNRLRKKAIGVCRRRRRGRSRFVVPFAECLAGAIEPCRCQTATIAGIVTTCSTVSGVGRRQKCAVTRRHRDVCEVPDGVVSHQVFGGKTSKRCSSNDGGHNNKGSYQRAPSIRWMTTTTNIGGAL